MATITQREIFSWKEIEKLGDLERLRLVLEYLPDEQLMLKMEGLRGKGRDDYPVRAVWNSILAGIIYEHKSIESLRRELKRNTRLCWLCGFELTKDTEIVPPAWVYSRFLKKLMGLQEEIDAIFDLLVEKLREELPGFGRNLGMDGKALNSAARRRKDEEADPDGRRDMDADKGVKKYWVEDKEGKMWQKVKSWFGYKLHLIADTDYELPAAYEVTKASRSEIPEGKKLIKDLQEKHPGIIGQCEHLMADRGLDDTELNVMLWEDYGIKPVIGIRNMWKDGEKTKLVEGTDNVVYDYKGTVYCYDMRHGYRREMAYGGFESERGALKYRCPKEHYGCRCSWSSQCEVKKAVRIKLDQDRRVFTPLARSSYKWGDYYRKRTAVERVNSRLDVSYGFEHHFIRGLAKMKLRMGLALVVMLSMASGRVKEKQKENMCSLVKKAA